MILMLCVGDLENLKCISSNQSAVVITWSMSYPLPHHGLVFKVSYAEAPTCGSGTTAGASRGVSTKGSVTVVSDLSPSTCYNLTVRPVAAGFKEGEGQSVICRTQQTGRILLFLLLITKTAMQVNTFVHNIWNELAIGSCSCVQRI